MPFCHRMVSIVVPLRYFPHKLNKAVVVFNFGVYILDRDLQISRKCNLCEIQVLGNSLSLGVISSEISLPTSLEIAVMSLNVSYVH